MRDGFPLAGLVWPPPSRHDAPVTLAASSASLFVGNSRIPARIALPTLWMLTARQGRSREFSRLRDHPITDLVKKQFPTLGKMRARGMSLTSIGDPISAGSVVHLHVWRH